MRLVDGTNQYNGKVEVYNRLYRYRFNYPPLLYQWGTISDNDWTELDANVVCRSLGFLPYGATPQYSRSNGVQSVLLSNITCTGVESSVWDCEYRFAATGNTYSTNMEVTCLRK